MDYSAPSDSKSKEEARRNRKVQPITSAPPKRQKTSPAMDILKQFIKTDVKSIRKHLVEDVLEPRAVDMLSDAIDTAKNLALYGDARTSRSSKNKKYDGNVTSYDEYYHNSGKKSSSTYRVGKFDIDIYPLDSRDDAANILDQMRQDIATYDFVSVADYYGYLGVPDERIEAVHYNYGWRNLDFVSIISGRHGYIIDLPKAERFKGESE